MTAPPPVLAPPLSPARIRLALLALALGGFGIGATEFVALGLLPNIAADLLPAAVCRLPPGGARPDRHRDLGLCGRSRRRGADDRRVRRPTAARGLLLALVVAFTVGTVAVGARPDLRAAWSLRGSSPPCRTAPTSASPRWSRRR